MSTRTWTKQRDGQSYIVCHRIFLLDIVQHKIFLLDSVRQNIFFLFCWTLSSIGCFARYRPIWNFLLDSVQQSIFYFARYCISRSLPPSPRDGISSRSGGVDISELTWEQKEQCLRLLFAKMNRHKTTTTALSSKNSGQTTPTMPALPAPPAHVQNADSASSPPVFITERSTGSERGVASPSPSPAGVRESKILQQTALEQVT